MPSADRRPTPRVAAATRDLLAVVGVWVLAFALTMALSTYVARTVFVFFWAAVLFAAWRRGFRWAAAAAVAAVLAVDYFVLPPVRSPRLLDPADLLTLGIFLLVAGAVSALAAGQAAARALAESQAERLREQAVELELQADSAQQAALELELTSSQLQQTAVEAESAREEAEKARRDVAAVLDALSDMVTAMDAAGRITYLNPAARASLRALGGDPDAAIGRAAWEVMPALRGTAFEGETRRAAEERRVVEYEAEIPGTGRWVETRVVPGADGMVTAFSRDTTDRRRALAADRAASDRARRLLAVTSGLSGARTPEEVADVIFREGLAAVGADAGSLALLHETTTGPEFEVVHTHGYSAGAVERFRRFPLRAGRPLSDALLARAPLLLGSRDEVRASYPMLVEELMASGYDAFVAVPVLSGGELLGGFSASFRGVRVFDDAMRTFLATLGEQCGLALARARAYAAEREAREFAGAILGSVRDGFLGLDGALRFTFVNARAEELLRRPASELLGRALDEAFPATGGAADGVVVVDAARRVLATQQPESVEAAGRVPGSWIEARLYPAPGGLTVFFQDVTARRRARDAGEFLVDVTRVLGASLEYGATLRAIARAAVPRLGDWCAVDVVREPARPTWPPALERLAVVHANPTMVALGTELATRYPTDWEADGGLAVVLRERRPLFIPEVTDAMLVAGARDPEHLGMLRTLGFRSVIAVPLVARDVLLGCLTLCTSESARRYDEADLALVEDLARRAAVAVDNARLFREGERSREEAEAANRAKGQFLSTMSHELRTPLNAIAGYTELLEMGVRGPVNEEQREDLARIRRSAKVLMSLVNDVLNFARIEAGQVEVHLGEVQLEQVLSELEGMVAPQLRAKRLRYTLNAVDACPVRADADRLKQILTNLLTNAVKFTPEGGHIEVSCEAPDPAPGAPPMARVRVRDSGRGIPADRLQVIFEPFVQIDRHLTGDSQQGVGLGLAISRELARAMGGELSVESTLGAGSTFTLALPRVAPAAHRGPPPVPPALQARP